MVHFSDLSCTKQPWRLTAKLSSPWHPLHCKVMWLCSAWISHSSPTYVAHTMKTLKHGQTRTHISPVAAITDRSKLKWWLKTTRCVFYSPKGQSPKSWCRWAEYFLEASMKIHFLAFFASKVHLPSLAHHPSLYQFYCRTSVSSPIRRWQH